MPKIFFVEGNIGTGKSTFLSVIEKYYPNCQVIYEPVDLWTSLTDDQGVNILDYFYNDTKRYAYTFQNLAFVSRIENMDLIDSTKEYVFIERSIWSDKNIFAKNCFEMGSMNSIEYKLYNRWFNWLEKKLELSEYTFIYLKCSAETSFERLTKRQRPEEKGVSLDYLKQIESRHEDWLSNIRHVLVDASVNLKDEHIFKEVFSNCVRKN